MKYIRKDNCLINIDKCVHIKIIEYESGDCCLWFQNEYGHIDLMYETKEEVRQDLMKIESFITAERSLLKL